MSRISNQKKVFPTFFISHGGGPWPWMKEEMPFFSELEFSLQNMIFSLENKPRAVLMISAHWEESDIKIMRNLSPRMLYDYYGFPEKTYSIQYPAPSDILLADEISKLLDQAQIPWSFDSDRGYDHGAFVPLSVMYPKADMPIVQISLQKDLDPNFHIRLGEVLSPLRHQEILIVGSGLSYHNLSDIFYRARAFENSKKFDGWLNDTILNSFGEERIQQLIHWEQAPAARLCHPREDHLIPLFVALGAAKNEVSKNIYHEISMGNFFASSFQFGEMS